MDLYLSLAILGVGGLTVAGAFWLAYKKGEDAQKLREVELDNAIKEAQLEEAAKSRLTPGDVRRRMRDGEF